MALENLLRTSARLLVFQGLPFPEEDRLVLLVHAQEVVGSQDAPESKGAKCPQERHAGHLPPPCWPLTPSVTKLPGFLLQNQTTSGLFATVLASRLLLHPIHSTFKAWGQPASRVTTIAPSKLC